MGPAMAEKMAKTVYTGPVMETFADYATEAVFGMLWTRPGLDHKTRAMITLSSDVCNQCWPEWKSIFVSPSISAGQKMN